ncbi:MAG: hypothetical protein J3Q66DRAFT_371809 [Benniella sp.]|nr:MAG: hypothetical protein J3Q66DRAFT_371809 [Benniella sp.]
MYTTSYKSISPVVYILQSTHPGVNSSNAASGKYTSFIYLESDDFLKIIAEYVIPRTRHLCLWSSLRNLTGHVMADPEVMGLNREKTHEPPSYLDKLKNSLDLYHIETRPASEVLKSDSLPP